MIQNMFPVRTVLQTNQTDLSFIRQYVLYQNRLQTNQTDLSQTICSLLEQYCRQINQKYQRQSSNYQNVMLTNQAKTSQTICSILEWNYRKIKQTYHIQFVNKLKGIVDKSNIPIVRIPEKHIILQPIILVWYQRHMYFP